MWRVFTCHARRRPPLRGGSGMGCGTSRHLAKIYDAHLTRTHTGTHTHIAHNHRDNGVAHKQDMSINSETSGVRPSIHPLYSQPAPGPFPPRPVGHNVWAIATAAWEAEISSYVNNSLERIASTAPKVSTRQPTLAKAAWSRAPYIMSEAFSRQSSSRRPCTAT